MDLGLRFLFRNKKVMGIVIKQIKKIPEYKVKEVVETYQENLVFESNEFECLVGLQNIIIIL